MGGRWVFLSANYTRHFLAQHPNPWSVCRILERLFGARELQSVKAMKEIGSKLGRKDG